MTLPRDDECIFELGDARCGYKGPDEGPCDKSFHDCRDRFNNEKRFGGFVFTPTSAGEQKWHRRFLEMAKLVSCWSKDPSTQVGSVIIDSKRRVLSLGYNGFPRGIDDTEERYADRQTKYRLVVHAEANAILNATAPLEGATMYSLHLPCEECIKLIIQKSIKRVVVLWQTEQRWLEHVPTLREAGIEVLIYDPGRGYTSEA